MLQFKVEEIRMAVEELLLIELSISMPIQMLTLKIVSMIEKVMKTLKKKNQSNLKKNKMNNQRNIKFKEKTIIKLSKIEDSKDRLTQMNNQ